MHHPPVSHESPGPSFRREGSGSTKYRVPASAAQKLFQAVSAEGENELSRPARSLWWSGIAAGMAMGTSVLAQATIRSIMPTNEWSPIVESFGYTFGFVIAVLGHLQLFTENTITTVLPVLKLRSVSCLRDSLRLWLTVFLANLFGACVFALMMTRGVVTPELQKFVVEVSHESLLLGPFEAFRYGIPAGFLVASMVWLTRRAQGERFVLIVFIAWLIAAGHFTHVIAGSVEVFVLVFSLGLSHIGKLLTFTLPCLLGNIVGGTALFALLAYAQVEAEIPHGEGDED